MAKAAQNPIVFGMSAKNDSALSAAEARLGLKSGIVSVYTDWNHEFPQNEAAHALERGAALLISWEPHDSEEGNDNQPLFNLDRIRTGVFDDYIARFAHAAAATERPVFVRWAAEMNGDWLPWSTNINGNSAGDYAETYRYVVDKARAAGGTNIKWMFNPITSYLGSTPLRQLYPGDSYVDWVGLDGYNWGSTKPWGWQSFDQVYTAGFQELRSVAAGKPIAIAEIGSAPGARKPAWITDSFAKAQAEGVKMFVWFEHNKETDWRMSSVRKSARAAHQAASLPAWIQGGNWAKVRSALGV